MTTPIRGRIRRPNMRRAVILFPSGLTLGNLFFGVFAIIAASRLEFTAAGVYVMFGGICDALDGRVARATNAGTEFGEELDSLVDAITFGLAPALIMYFAVLNRDGWDWVWVFIFAACAVLRLARFNIEQAGTAKTYFQGLPSPAAGITLASYYWFSQSSLYTYGAIADLKWHVLLRYLMVVLSFLMISNVPYPSFPRTGFRSLRSLGATILVVGALVLLGTRRLEYFFPIALLYVAWGLARWGFSGLFERRQPTLPYDLSEGEDDDEDDFELDESRVHASRQSHRGERTGGPDRSRTRTSRTEPAERAEPGGIAARPDRAPRPLERPDRLDRPERPDRAERSERSDRPAVAERTSDGEHAARRDKKKDRPKRPDRSDRPDRQDRPDRAQRPARADTGPPMPSVPPIPPIPPMPAMTSMPAMPQNAPSLATPERSAPLTSGADSIPAGRSESPASLADDGEEYLPDEAGDEQLVADTKTPGTEGAAPRKRKRRRRRRGERKERGVSDAAPGLFPDAPGVRAPSLPERDGAAASPPDVDRSPYASAPLPSPSAAPPSSQPAPTSSTESSE